MSNMDKTSWWYYFEKTNNGENTKCRNCNDWEKQRGKDKGTNGMKNHLERVHPSLYSEKLEVELEKSN